MHSRIAHWTIRAIDNLGTQSTKTFAQRTVPFSSISGGRTYADTFAKRFGEAAKESGFLKTVLNRGAAHAIALGYELPKNLLNKFVQSFKNFASHPKASLNSAWSAVRGHGKAVANAEKVQHVRQQVNHAVEQMSTASKARYNQFTEYLNRLRPQGTAH